MAAISKAMAPMPSTVHECKKEATQLGLLGFKHQEAAKTPRGQLLSWCYSSWKAGRSCCHSSMVLLGNSGVGKSSVVNHLLNVKMAAVSDSQSETRSTTEFAVSIDVPRLDVTGLSLGIVDTPGFNDTDGLAQDACNLLSIDNFCKTHPALNHGKFYPNAVLLCIQATDTRFMGKNSALSKTLTAVRYLHVVDTQKPNVIIVLTWACALRGKGDKWKNKLMEKSRQVNEILCDTLGVTAPVVWLENDPEEEELESDGDFTILPDGTLQPKNLYEAMVDMMTTNEDSLGMVTIKEVFGQSSQGIPFKKGHSVEAKLAEKEELSPKEQDIWNKLMQSQSSGVILPEVTTAINRYIESHASTLSETDRNEALFISTDIVEGLGITSIQDLSHYSIGMLNQALRKKLSSFGVKLVKEVFNVKEQSLSPEAFLNVGRGFNLLNDEVKPLAIFQMTDSCKETEFGFSVPEGLSLTKVQQSQLYMEHFESKESYVKARLQQLNVVTDVDARVFSMKLKGGLTWSASTSNSSSQTERSFMLERRLLQLQIEDLSKMKPTDAFKAHVQRLPAVYDSMNTDNRVQFEDFFSNWGHFVVTSAYGGGSVEAKVNSISTPNSQDEALEIRIELESKFDMLGRGFSASAGYSGQGSEKFNSKDRLAISSLQWNGGDSQLHCLSLKDTSPEMWKKWMMSLTSQPSLLTTEMSLTPMHSIVDMVDPKKTAACRQAIGDLFGGHFQAVAVKEREDKRKALEPKPTRQETSEETPDPPSASGGSCFPLDSVVQVRRGGRILQIPLRDLQIGDEALTFSAKGVRKFSRVFMLNHRSDSCPTEFLHVTTEADGDSTAGSIRLTGDHMIFVRVQGKVNTVFASDLRIGQELLVDHPGQEKFLAQRVTSIELVTGRGFCAPITMRGSIIVDSVWASCYANVPRLVGRIDAQSVAHGCMGALRLAHRCGLGRSALTIPDGKEMPPAVSWAVNRVLPLLLKLQ